MLRVLMTIDAVGGVWRYALDLAGSLHDFGIKLLLVGFGPSPQPQQYIECAALPNVELVWTDEPLDWTVTHPSLLDKTADHLATLAAHFRAEVLHLNVPAQAAGLTCDLPLVVVSHSCVPTWWATVRGTPLPDDWAWHLQRNRDGLDRADIIVVPSKSHGEEVARCYGLSRNFRVVHNAAPSASSGELKQKLVVSVGRWWDDGKNGSVLDMAAQASPWPIVLAGPLVDAQGNAACFSFVETTGSLSHPEVQALMRRAAVFAAPSLYEPFGLAVAEAASAGAALVLSDIPTFRELWHGAALFVPPTDPERWAEAFQLVAADDALRCSLGQAAQRRTESFTPARQAEGMWAVYQDVRTAGGK